MKSSHKFVLLLGIFSSLSLFNSHAMARTVDGSVSRCELNDIPQEDHQMYASFSYLVIGTELTGAEAKQKFGELKMEESHADIFGQVFFEERSKSLARQQIPGDGEQVYVITPGVYCRRTADAQYRCVNTCDFTMLSSSPIPN